MNRISAALVIVTRNRRAELGRALRSALAQTVPFEIHVLDDFSTDGTPEMVRSEFPTVNLVQSDSQLGYVVQRNRAARLTNADIIISIDDDAEFSSTNIIEDVIDSFEDPKIAAVAIPFVEPRKGRFVRQSPPTGDAVWITDMFVGTANAVRRHVFTEIGGYREDLVHQGEERDLCIRLQNQGYFVRVVKTAPIVHHESPRRDHKRMNYYGRRNDIIFAWINVPKRYLVPHLIVTTLNGIRTAFHCDHPWSMLQGIFAGYAYCFRNPGARRPVRAETYRLSRCLRKRGPLRMPAETGRA